jgi:hypothetical protein
MAHKIYNPDTQQMEWTNEIEPLIIDETLYFQREIDAAREAGNSAEVARLQSISDSRVPSGQPQAEEPPALHPRIPRRAINCMEPSSPGGVRLQLWNNIAWDVTHATVIKTPHHNVNRSHKIITVASHLNKFTS